MKSKISIGILAYNEALSISQTLHSLFEQSLFNRADTDIEILVVANGCTDDTSVIACSTLEQLVKPIIQPHISWNICEIKEAGLANAWNNYVHDLSSPQSNYLIVMSADIQFLDLQTLESLVQTLEAHAEAWVSVDRRIKDIALKEKKTLAEKISTLVSEMSGSKQVEEEAAWISGQLYCARSKILRKIQMPTTLPTDDAFLYTMIVTDSLKDSIQPKRVILAKSASHVFEAYTQVSRLFRHEKWLIFGQTVNELLYADLLAHSKQEEDVSLLIRQRNEQDPFWLNKLVQTAIKTKGWWLIPKFILTRRFQSLAYKPFLKSILLFPLVMVAFIVDLFLSFQVNLEMQNRGGFNNWTSSGSWGK